MKKTNHLYAITLLQDFANLKKGDTMHLSGIRAASLIKRGIANSAASTENIIIDDVVIGEAVAKPTKRKRK